MKVPIEARRKREEGRGEEKEIGKIPCLANARCPMPCLPDARCPMPDAQI
ncbi:MULTISPECIES: hypothetical protein [unclassified Microcoleus]